MLRVVLALIVIVASAPALAGAITVYNDTGAPTTVRFEAVGCGGGTGVGTCRTQTLGPGAHVRYVFPAGAVEGVARVACMKAGETEADSFQLREGCARVHAPGPGALVRGGAVDANHTWTLGTGWGVFVDLFAGDDGHIYGLRADGELFWYHNTAVSGSISQRWAGGGGTVVGTGWNGGIAHAFGGYGGAIYAVRGDGTLARYADPRDGSRLGAPTVIGGGWDGLAWAAGGELGVIFAGTPDGDVYRYEDGGTPAPAPGRRIVEGGGVASCAGSGSASCLARQPQVFGGAGGVLFAVGSDGSLWRYQATETTLADGVRVGRGYDRYELVFGGWQGRVYGVLK